MITSNRICIHNEVASWQTELVLVFLALMGQGALSCFGQEAPVRRNSIPELNDVTHIEVELYSSPFEFRDVPKFELPGDAYVKFLRFFPGPRRRKAWLGRSRDRYCARVCEVGRVLSLVLVLARRKGSSSILVARSTSSDGIT